MLTPALCCGHQVVSCCTRKRPHQCRQGDRSGRLHLPQKGETHVSPCERRHIMLLCVSVKRSGKYVLRSCVHSTYLMKTAVQQLNKGFLSFSSRRCFNCATTPCPTMRITSPTHTPSSRSDGSEEGRRSPSITRSGRCRSVSGSEPAWAGGWPNSRCISSCPE